MSNMTVNQRNQIDGAAFSGASERIRRGSERGAAIYNLVALIVAAGLSVAAFSLISGWAQWVVFGAIVATALGFMIAISPNRRGW
jgi:hypothetical protein